MKYVTTQLIVRLGLKDRSDIDAIGWIIDAINKLDRWKFPAGVHTIYVDAISDLSDGNDYFIRLAKEACNERAFTPCYEL